MAYPNEPVRMWLVPGLIVVILGLLVTLAVPFSFENGANEVLSFVIAYCIIFFLYYNGSRLAAEYGPVTGTVMLASVLWAGVSFSVYAPIRILLSILVHG